MRNLLRLIALALALGAGLRTIPVADGFPTGAVEPAPSEACGEPAPMFVNDQRAVGGAGDAGDNGCTPAARERGSWPRRRPFFAHRAGTAASAVGAGGSTSVVSAVVRPGYQANMSLERAP